MQGDHARLRSGDVQHAHGQRKVDGLPPALPAEADPQIAPRAGDADIEQPQPLRVVLPARLFDQILMRVALAGQRLQLRARFQRGVAAI